MLQVKSSLRETPTKRNGIQKRGVSFRKLGGSAVDSKMLELICKGKRLQILEEGRENMPGRENIRSKCIEEAKAKEYIRNNKQLHPCSLKFQKEGRTPVFKFTNHSLLGSEYLCPHKLHMLKSQGLPWWHSDQDPTLPMQGAQVQSMVRELDPTSMLQLRVCMPQLRSTRAATKELAGRN